jgi:hypothetical protein
MHYFHSNFFTAGLTALFWYFGMWVFQLFFTIVYLFSKKDKNVLTHHINETKDDAFYEETKYSKTFSYWPGIVSAVSRPGFVAVYITAHSAHVIPNRVFSSNSQRAEFLAFVNEKIQANKAS